MEWLRVSGAKAPYMAYYRRLVTAVDGLLEFDFSADETCQLFLDGVLIAEGPERDAANHWHSQHCRMEATGDHCLVARVLCFGKELTAHNQLSVCHGFACSLTGGWEAVVDNELKCFRPWPNWGCYPRLELSAGKHAKWQAGQGDGWRAAEVFDDSRELFDAEFPSMLGALETNFTVNGNRLTFGDYVCVWPVYEFEGQGTIELRWAETGYLTSNFSRHTLKGEKGRRDGQVIIGDFDVFHVDGECTFADWQYRSGRIIDWRCTGTARLKSVRFIRHGYPYQYRECVKDSIVFKSAVMAMSLRTLECCTHDTFIDCPYYERMMYIGDARVEALCAYAVADDGRMARKALRVFAASQIPNGNVLSRYPAKIDQYIPSFSVIFILMLHDFACWQDDMPFVASLLPCSERIAAYLFEHKGEDRLYHPDGWNFLDWTWPKQGVPYGTDEDGNTNAPLNMLVLLAFRKLAALERYVGRTEQAKVYDCAADDLEAAIRDTYYSIERGMYADDKKQRFYSEHSQVLALLNRRDDRLLEALHEPTNFVTSCGIYFSYYYLEVCCKYGLKELFDKRVAMYSELAELGLKTMPEDFIMTRSDCHAFSSHVLFHTLCMNGLAKPRRTIE